MSKATKRKYVRREAVEDEVKPTGDQIIVKVRQFLVWPLAAARLSCFR